MFFRAIAIALLTTCLWALTTCFAPSAQALTQVKLSELTYHECPSELAEGAVTSGGMAMPANCFIITGKTENPSGKPVVNADIFGRIYDANGDSVMQNRTRLGSVEEIKPGIGRFELRVSVPANQPTPLKLEQFKAAGFTGMVRR
jgi:hypothetical protein